MTRLFYLALALIGLHASFAYAEIDVYSFDTPQQEKQFQDLSNTLRCPKCQNNTIADSNAALAQDLRNKVYQMTKQGQSKQQIVDYMVARYGNFVTYEPPFSWSTAVLWLGPLMVLVIGFGSIVWRSRRASSIEGSGQWDEDKQSRLDSLLQKSEHNSTHTPNHKSEHQSRQKHGEDK